MVVYFHVVYLVHLMFSFTHGINIRLVPFAGSDFYQINLVSNFYGARTKLPLRVSEASFCSGSMDQLLLCTVCVLLQE